MRVVVLGLVAFALVTPGIVDAGSATWSTTPATENWNTAGNWLPMTVPNGSSDTATFALGNVTDVSVTEGAEVNSIIFNPGASAYSITVDPMHELILSGAGIINQSGTMQNFVTNPDKVNGSGTISFRNGATAGQLVIFHNRGTSDLPVSWTAFLGNSTAGSATFINEGGIFLGGYTAFFDTSNAGTATFICNPGMGTTQFSNSSNAANAIITANGNTNNGGKGGNIFFDDASTAGNATLTADGGSRARIIFANDSTGGTARVKVSSCSFCSSSFDHGRLEISQHNPPGITIGSLEGDGDVLLGANTLTIGANNLNTTFGGIIRDGSGGVTKIGTGTLILTGSSTYTGGTFVNAGRLLVSNDYSGTGSGAVTVSNNGSVFGGTGEILGAVTVNAGAALLAGVPTVAHGTLSLAGDVTLHSGASIQLVIGASGVHSTLARLNGTWSFAANQAFDLINLGAQPGFYSDVITHLAGDPGNTASWTITTPGFSGTFAYHPGFGQEGSIDLTITVAPPLSPTVLGNISSRLRVETGDNVLIGGFIITGTQQKKVIVRAIGPSLSSFVPGVLVDPVLELRDSSGGLIRSNDNWRSDQESEIIAAGIPPSDNLESAIVATLPANNSAYTAIVRGVNNGTGIGVVEAYDLDQTANSKLANISTRGLVQTGDNVLIGGLIVLGQTPLSVVVRAIGPSLPVPGALADPTLELYDGNGALIVSNDNWRSDQEAEIIATGIPPSNDLEAAIVRNLSPGNYTAIVRGVNSATGVALVEAYGLN